MNLARAGRVLAAETLRQISDDGATTPSFVLLFSLVATGHIKLRRIDGWRKIAAVLRQKVAAR